MKNLLLLVTIISCTRVFSQEVSVVTGKFPDSKFSKVSLTTDENPLTGAREEFIGIVLGSGKFEIQAELYAPTVFILVIDERPAIQLLLCPGKNLNIKADSSGLRYEGASSHFSDLRNILGDEFDTSIAYAENHGIDSNDTKKLADFLFDLKNKNAAQIPGIAEKLKLNPCEIKYIENSTAYNIYTYLWSDLLSRGHKLNSDAFQFMERLPLNDVEAAKTSLEYNRAINVYIFIKLRLERKWYAGNSFDPESDAFRNVFYDQILKEIEDRDVRNITLTRNIISLLSAGSTSAESLFKRYVSDCSDPLYRNIAFKYYSDYEKLKAYSKADLKIENLEGALFEKLNQKKGKVLYIDFWASWCSPCIESIPSSLKLQEKYNDDSFEVVFVSIDDNIGKAEAMSRKLGLKGSVIYLNKEQSEQIHKDLKFNGIPHYVLVDKNGNIVDVDAPGPDSLTAEVQISKLLEK